jgi:RNA polymerase sigma-70 factor, ECF subfamily
MDSDERRAHEAELRRRFDAGDLDGAMARAVEAYGDELFGFLFGLVRDDDRAADLFGDVCERMWRGLPTFRWESSFRVWMYTIARNEFLRSGRRVNRQRRELPLSRAPHVIGAIDKARSSTPPHLRTEIKDRFAKLRAELSPEDHMLLGLRIDRKLPWSDIARVLGSGDPATVDRDAATLRKRFERLKARLKELARDAD